MLISAFIVIMVIYEFLVRRFNVMRFLFGMKIQSERRYRHQAQLH